MVIWILVIKFRIVLWNISNNIVVIVVKFDSSNSGLCFIISDMLSNISIINNISLVICIKLVIEVCVVKGVELY